MIRIELNKAIDKVESLLSDGLLVNIVWNGLDGKERSRNVRKGVKKGLSTDPKKAGPKYDAKEKGLIWAYDMDATNPHRVSIVAKNIKFFTAQGKTYRVV